MGKKCLTVGLHFRVIRYGQHEQNTETDIQSNCRNRNKQTEVGPKLINA